MSDYEKAKFMRPDELVVRRNRDTGLYDAVRKTDGGRAFGGHINSAAAEAQVRTREAGRWVPDETWADRRTPPPGGRVDHERVERRFSSRSSFGGFNVPPSIAKGRE